MAQIQFTPTWISKVPFTTKRKHYTDSHPRSKFGNCDLVLVVGGRTKTGYLRFRKYINGKRKDQLIKLADMTSNAISLSELRDIYETKVIEIKRNESTVLKKGSRVAMLEREIFSGDRLIAKASGSFAVSEYR